jgi:subtilase family serine protease
MFHTAYNLPCTPGGPVQAVCNAPQSFGPQVIGIVDAYDDPTVESDMATFDTQYGLPACTKANGCLTVVNQTGGSTLPASNGDWALEISLDVQTAHMICQTCKILLVEANSSYFNDLGVAENEAAALGATEVSNSYGATDGNWETPYDSYYNHPGIAITASAGDSGVGAEYPAASASVIAVGGTTLTLNTDNTYNGESVWFDSGSGCSAIELANTWQTSLSNWSATTCSSVRGAADVAADADPSTGAAVYDSTPYGTQTGWYQVGGTSLSSPIIAATIALAGGVAGVSNPQSVPYANFNASNSHDVTTGSNGACTNSMCVAGPGYDGPTGLGSPNGTAGFTGGGIAPGPTATPTNTATPTATSTPKPTPTPTCRQTGKKCH